MAENPLELERWLAFVTMDLAEESKARVRSEIEGHYWDAVEDHRQEGKSEEEARRLALRSLGDRHSALVSFKFHYLTKWDVGMIQRLQWKNSPFEDPKNRFPNLVHKVIWGILFASVPILFIFAPRFYAYVVIAILLVSCVPAWIMGTIKTRIFEKYPYRRGLLLACVTEGVGQILLLLLGGKFILWLSAREDVAIEVTDFWLYRLMVCFFCGYWVYVYCRLSRKLASHERVGAQ